MTDPRARRALMYRIVLIAILVIIVAKAIGVYVERDRRDYWRWYKAAGFVLQDKALARVPSANLDPNDPHYRALEEYRLPPAFAVYVAPLGLLPYGLYVMVWYLLSLLAAAVAVLLTMKLLWGRWLPEEPWALILPLLAIGPFLYDDVHNGQHNLFLLALLMLAAWLMSRRLHSLAGASIGLAVAVKFFPIAVLLPLALLRRWRVCAWSLVAAVLWTLVVPGVFRGFGRQWEESAAWYSRIISPYTTGKTQREWGTRGFEPVNQAMYAAVHHLTREVDANSGQDSSEVRAGAGRYVNVVALSRKGSDLAFAGLIALCAIAIELVGTVAIFHSGVRRRIPPPGVLLGLQAAIALAMVLLSSPIAWGYFYTLLLPATAVGAWVLFRGPGAPDRRWLRCLFWCLLPVHVVCMIGALVPIGQAVGTLAWSALAWLVMMLVVYRLSFQPVPPEQTIEGDPTQTC